MSEALRPIKVAYFVPPSQHFAGIERVVHEIASGLASSYGSTFDVHVIFASAYEEAALSDTAYTLHVLGVDRLRNVAAGLRRCVAEHGFDVLVTPQVEASVIAWTATRGLGLRTLLPHLHGNPRLEFDEGTARTRASFRLFRTVVARDVPAILCVSPSLRDYAARTVGRRTTTVFAKNPVADRTAGDAQPRRPSPDGRHRFVSVGRLSRQKGQDVLMRALALARPDLPPCQLTLVGNGPAEAELQALAGELGLSDVVSFAGYQSDPAPYLRAADTFVLASRWEGFGVALVEALQCGLPVLATDCEFGPADVITDPALGRLVRPDDPQALAEGLRAAVGWPSSPETQARRRLAAAAYGRDAAIAMHFSILRATAAT